jgi:hypothetical protein
MLIEVNVKITLTLYALKMWLLFVDAVERNFPESGMSEIKQAIQQKFSNAVKGQKQAKVFCYY